MSKKGGHKSTDVALDVTGTASVAVVIGMDASITIWIGLALVSLAATTAGQSATEPLPTTRAAPTANTITAAVLCDRKAVAPTTD